MTETTREYLERVGALLREGKIPEDYFDVSGLYQLALGNPNVDSEGLPSVPASLSIESIQQARETLTAAFSLYMEGKPGARDQDDPAGVMAEAKRNLTALVEVVHGREAWVKMMEDDEEQSS